MLTSEGWTEVILVNVYSEEHSRQREQHVPVVWGSSTEEVIFKEESMMYKKENGMRWWWTNRPLAGFSGCWIFTRAGVHHWLIYESGMLEHGMIYV